MTVGLSLIPEKDQLFSVNEPDSAEYHCPSCKKPWSEPFPDKKICYNDSCHRLKELEHGYLGHCKYREGPEPEDVCKSGGKCPQKDQCAPGTGCERGDHRKIAPYDVCEGDR